MEWLERLNAALDYVEGALEGELSYAEAARRAMMSPYNFQRVFSFVADMPLSEYIRRRRLTLAALQLQRCEDRVLDVALRFGYDSASSFARAFQALHGVSPAEARREGASLKAYPRISFYVSIKGDLPVEYRIEKKPAFRMVGIVEHMNTTNGEQKARIPVLWDEMRQNEQLCRIAALSREQPGYLYGVCANCGEHTMDYLIAAVSNAEVPGGMVALDVPAATWAIFPCVGPVPQAQHKGWQRVFTEWMPTSGYELTDAPELEWYSVGDTDAADYLSEIWLPVRPITA